MGQMLTAKQVAEVKGCSGRYIKRLIQEGKLQAQEVLNDKNRKTYLVPLEALDEELQQKWYQMNLENPSEEISTPEPVPDKKAVDHFSESERQEIDFWISLVEQWQQYRMKPGVTCKADVDKKFVTLCGLEYPDKEISVDILYRKWKAVKENDLDGLIDKRGKWKKGTSSIDDTIWQAFLYFYLDESQHPIQKCLDYTKMWAQEKDQIYTPTFQAIPLFTADSTTRCRKVSRCWDVRDIKPTMTAALRLSEDFMRISKAMSGGLLITIPLMSW